MSFVIQVRMKGERRAKLLMHSGGLTTKQIHASRFSDRARANALAREILSDNAATVEWTKVVGA